MVVLIRDRQKAIIEALSLFVPEREMLKKIRRASSGRVSDLEALTRKEAFVLLRELTQQPSVIKTVNPIMQSHGQ